MADQQAISDADVQSLAQKLTQFKQTLTPGEHAALAAVIQRGMPQGEDVSGYVMGLGSDQAGSRGIDFSLIYDPFKIGSSSAQDRKGPRGL